MKAQLKFFYIVSGISLILDQWTKYFAQVYLRNQMPKVYFNNLFRLEYAENPGAFLGMGNSLADPIRFWIFVIFVFFLMIALAVYVHRKLLTKQEIWAYSLIFSGGVGNLIDRTFHENGHVVDFMNAGIGNLRTGIFNIADMAIMGGLFLLLIAPKKKKA
jgi:signal peptidase II